ncbi:MAG: methionine adenosyltransferase [Ignavibacteria bacterium]|nr:methionine adenosyltransferase [Ignavibacteria bacterium]
MNTQQQSPLQQQGEYLWSSEYVSAGHPDKLADQLSDAVLDHYLALDPDARVACETLVKGDTVYVAGEITSTAHVSEDELRSLLRTTICGVGYNSNDVHFNGNTCSILFNISQQAPEINTAVGQGALVTAGDQGIMFGYATRDTPTRMPLAIYLAKLFIEEAYGGMGVRYALQPDMKSQVSLLYSGGVATSVQAVVLSMCHLPSLTLHGVREMFSDAILPRVLAAMPHNIAQMFSAKTVYHINPAGSWNVGGPVSDCGLTGRKIVVDQYGADCPIGGGAFSGKDPSKVDRSAAYMARWLALRALSQQPSAQSIQVQLAYAIGQAEPVSYRVYDPTTGIEYGLPDVSAALLTPGAIIDTLHLRAPIYGATARRGHFGIAAYEKRGYRHYSWESE